MPDVRDRFVGCRYGQSEFDLTKIAAGIMGQSVGAFSRTATVMVARTVIEAAGQLNLGPGEGDWGRCGISGRFERKEEA